jgi:hypothetical protein
MDFVDGFGWFNEEFCMIFKRHNSLPGYMYRAYYYFWFFTHWMTELSVCAQIIVLEF